MGGPLAGRPETALVTSASFSRPGPSSPCKPTPASVLVAAGGAASSHMPLIPHSLRVWPGLSHFLPFLLPQPSSVPQVEVCLVFLTMRKRKQAVLSEGSQQMGQLPEVAGKRV